MKKITFQCIMSLCIVMFIAAAGYCSPLKQVYLSDGSVVECQSFGHRDGKIMVIVNRDVVLELNRSEVDMKRTFASPPRTKKHPRTTRANPGAVQAKMPANQPAKSSPAANASVPRQGRMSSSVKTTVAAPKQNAGSAGPVSPPPKAVATPTAPAPGTSSGPVGVRP